MTTPTLTIFRGVSGSGKSTWARNQNAAVVSRDSLRVALFGSDGPEYYTHPDLKAREQFVTKVEHAAISEHLKAGRDVISDNTNIQPKFAQKIADIGYRLGAEVEVKVFDIPLQDALLNNSKRARMGGREVPDAAIRKQHNQLAGTKDWVPTKPYAPKPYSGTPGKPDAFLFDLDGTIFHMGDKRGPFDWMKVDVDDLDDAVADMVNALWAGGLIPIAMSGRDEVCRDLTEHALNDNGVPFQHLFMRPRGDMRKDSIIKAELFDTYVRDNFNVRFVIDDRQQVVDTWRMMGLKCAQVAEGDF